MLLKTDLILLLTDMQENGEDVTDKLKEVMMSQDIPIDIVKFINDSRQLDVAAFYERIRKNYNNKKSSLYKNIVSEVDDPNDALTTLSAYIL